MGEKHVRSTTIVSRSKVCCWGSRSPNSPMHSDLACTVHLQGEMGLFACIGVLLFSTCNACFVEAFGWYMVYRKPGYQKLKRQIEKIVEELEKKKAESLLMDKEKKRDKSRKDVGRLEKDLADLTKELQNLATPSKLMVSLLVMAIMFVINRSFTGFVVAKLPFVPFSLIQRLSHRGLAGDDPTDCSMAFLFALCQVGVNRNIAKLVGSGQPKGVKEFNPFQELGPSYDEAHTKTQ